MNSHQRRKDRRQWRYVVHQRYSIGQTWAWHNQEYLVRFQWCQAQFGNKVNRCGWRSIYNVPLETIDGVKLHQWQFNCPKRAALFALRWA